MAYLIGIGAFALGFFLGQLLLARLLRDLSREQVLELMKNDTGARWKYGLLNWGVALGCAAVAVTIWRWYVPA